MVNNGYQPYAVFFIGSQCDPHSRWNVVYYLRSEKFLHLTTLDDPPLNVPLRFFAEPAALFKRINALEDKDLYGRAEKLFNRLQEYMIAAVTLADMSIKDIAPIFERINSSGTPLTVVDLMRAANLVTYIRFTRRYQRCSRCGGW